MKLKLIYSNNSIEINVLECTEKENFAFDKLDSLHTTETESAAGRIGANLQEKAVKLLQRRRWLRINFFVYASCFL